MIDINSLFACQPEFSYSMTHFITFWIEFRVHTTHIFVDAVVVVLFFLLFFQIKYTDQLNYKKKYYRGMNIIVSNQSEWINDQKKRTKRREREREKRTLTTATDQGYHFFFIKMMKSACNYLNISQNWVIISSLLAIIYISVHFCLNCCHLFFL